MISGTIFYDSRLILVILIYLWQLSALLMTFCGHHPSFHVILVPFSNKILPDLIWLASLWTIFELFLLFFDHSKVIRLFTNGSCIGHGTLPNSASIAGCLRFEETIDNARQNVSRIKDFYLDIVSMRYHDSGIPPNTELSILRATDGFCGVIFLITSLPIYGFYVNISKFSKNRHFFKFRFLLQNYSLVTIVVCHRMK